MHRWLILSSIVLLLPAAAGAVPTAVVDCRPGRVQLVMDRSTSMYETLASEGRSKWAVAKSAVTQMLTDYESQAEIGMTLFPEYTLNCGDGGELRFRARRDQKDEILADPEFAPFAQNGFTPIGEVLGEIATASYYDFMRVADRRKFVILLTDGREDCPGAEMPNDQIIAKVTTLLEAHGIKTFVIGFGEGSVGDGVDAQLLGDLAVAGGTARAGCDPDAPTPTSPNLCYYQADDEAGLVHAFDEILVVVSQEECDGEDNDCNGQIDDGIPAHQCSSDCGAGESRCVLGEWTACDAPQPQPEVCDDHVDNDCDGNTDEDCGCVNGSTQNCGKDTGECSFGTQTCVDHEWQECVGGDGPSPEVCDHLDNDCDGIADDGLQCDCYVGQQETCGPPNVGYCHSGTRTCNADGTWGPCEGAVYPGTETCDNIDNDCDGEVDEPTRSGDDDAHQSLCLADEVCEEGHCVKVPPVTGNPPPHQANGDPTACGCNTGEGNIPIGTFFLGMAVLGLLFVTRRRA